MTSSKSVSSLTLGCQPSSPAAQPSPAQETVHCQPAATSRDLLSTASPPFTCHRDVSRQSMQAQFRVLVFRDKYINVTCSQLIQTNR